MIEVTIRGDGLDIEKEVTEYQAKAIINVLFWPEERK